MPVDAQLLMDKIMKNSKQEDLSKNLVKEMFDGLYEVLPLLVIIRLIMKNSMQEDFSHKRSQR